MLKNPVENERNISSAKFAAISCQDSPESLIGTSVGICQRALVDESGMIRTQMGLIYQEIVAVHGTLCTIPPHNSNQ
jgi:hypothetical protein